MQIIVRSFLLVRTIIGAKFYWFLYILYSRGDEGGDYGVQCLGMILYTVAGSDRVQNGKFAVNSMQIRRLRWCNFRLSVSLSAFFVFYATRQAQGENNADQLKQKKRVVNTFPTLQIPNIISKILDKRKKKKL